jgi:hypothetical protein
MFENQETENNPKLVEPELEEHKNNLTFDIDNIDLRLIYITKNMNLIQSNIDRMTNIILNFKQSNNSNTNIGSFYSIQSDLLKTLTGYNDSYEKLLNLKFKYRAEQNNLSLRIIRFYQLEMKKLENDLQDDDVNYKSVLNAISKLGATQSDVNSNDDVDTIDFEFDEDEKI